VNWLTLGRAALMAAVVFWALVVAAHLSAHGEYMALGSVAGLAFYALIGAWRLFA
jgi:hypothetical protein